MGNATGLPFLPPQLFTSTGLVAAGYKLFVYAAGTTSKVNTYTDVGLTTPNTNPIILDSAGRCTIFLAPASYKFVLAPPTDTDPPSSPEWTRDNQSALSSFNVNIDVEATFGENVTARQCVYLNDGSGGFTAGTWRLTSSAANPYQSSSASTIGFVVTNTLLGQVGAVRILGRMEGFTGLTAGAVYYIDATNGAITLTPPTLTRAVGQADTTTSLIISEWLADPLAILQVFTATGTWIKNPRAKAVTIVCIGAGGGGGSGRRGAVASDRFGGGGGAGAGYTPITLNASLLGTTETVTVGTGGPGGAGIVADNTNGNNGTNGGATTFGTWVVAAGGPFGSGGTAAAGGAGIASLIQCLSPGGNGGAGSNGAGTQGSAGTYFASGGGGGGGGINAVNATGNGAAGGVGSPANGVTLSGGTGGVVAGADATVGTGTTANNGSGGGGGGGGAATAGTFNAGKAGGIYGAGGGGGGAVINGTAGSNGGNGASGICLVIQH